MPRALGLLVDGETESRSGCHSEGRIDRSRHNSFLVSAANLK